MGKMEAMLRLACRHGRGVIFTVEELDSASVRFHWLSSSGALALFSTPSGNTSLSLNLAGLNEAEEAAAAHYLREITRSSFPMAEVIPAGGASALIGLAIAGRQDEFAFLSKLIHGVFWKICRDTYQQRRSWRRDLRT
jgi:hypothetical protein